MNSCRILIVTNRVPYPLHDGGALAIDAMIRGYQNQGLQVRVVAMNTLRHFVPDEKVKTLYPTIEGFTAIPFDNRIKPIKLAGNFLFSNAPEHAQRFYTKAFEAELLAIIEGFKPDVIQIESLFLSGYLPAVKSTSQAKLVLRMHNIEYEVWGRLAKESSGLKAFYLEVLAKRMRSFEEQIWRKYDLLLAITETDAAIVRELDAGLPVIVAPFGIDINPQTLKLPEAFTETYHVGAMDWLPNAAAMDWLIKDVWPVVKKAVPKVSFSFAGRHMPDRFQENLPEGIHCYGEVPDVEAFYADKTVLLVPLRAGGGIRVKILEAMAAGKLVISTAIGMQGIEAVPDVHYLQANTPEEFATALKWANDEVGKAQQMILAAREMVVEKYNLVEITKRVVKQLTD